MIIRIVKMTLIEEEVSNFCNMFSKIKSNIEQFEGCESVILLLDKNQNNIVFTYSIWWSEAYLNNYRHSEFFENTWKKTKTFFQKKAEAWTCDKIY